MTLTQPEFRAALMDAQRPVPAGLLDGAGQQAGARFDVYRNNVAVSLTEALHNAFPVLTRLIGAETMDQLAALFLRAHPPSSPLMMHYGAAMPDFLAALPQLAHLGYLPDVARLELAMRRSYHAADANTIAPDAMAALAPDQLLITRFRFAPSMELIPSDWPLFDIWRFNSQPDAPKPRAIAQDVLITRPEFDPVPSPLPAGGAACLTALRDGQMLGDALSAAAEAAPDFDLAPLLTQLLQGGAIIHLTTES